MTVSFEHVRPIRLLQFPFLFWLALSGLGSLSCRTLLAQDSTGSNSREESWLSPAALAGASANKTLFVGCGTAPALLIIEPPYAQISRKVALPAPVCALVLNAEETRIFAVCGNRTPALCEIDAANGTLLRQRPLRYDSTGPVLSPDGKTIFLCERFNSAIAVYDLQSGQLQSQIPVSREPIAAALMGGGRLIVAHHLPGGRGDNLGISVPVSFVDVQAGAVVKELALPSGSSLARDIRISPNGQFAGVTHNLGRFQFPTTQVERGWMNSSALTLIDLKQERVVSTVLLDEIDRGAANPWSLCWSSDGRCLAISHAGTHEVSLIRFPELIAKLAKLERADQTASDLAFLAGLRARIKLKGKGPRALAIVGDRLLVADYFSDQIEVIDLTKVSAGSTATPLHGSLPVDSTRRGEMFFNDATLSFQGWQSCATCHSEDGRVDGLNWDLLNDGIGNPKNTKSLLLSHRTPPAMSSGVRETAETAVRAGLRHILFSVQPEQVANDLDEWLKSLQPLPGPHAGRPEFSAAARRGQHLFQSARVGCAGCHPQELGTNMAQYDVGTASGIEPNGQLFDTPALKEIWRTAPYLHDGSAATLRDVLTTRNPSDRHGHTSQLTADELQDLIEYLLTL